MKRTLDFIKPIEIETENVPLNIHSLEYMSEGIIFLANLMKNQEDKFKKENPLKSQAKFYMSSKNAPITNIGNWFSVSLISYLQTISLLDIMNKNGWDISQINMHAAEIKDAANKYKAEIAPEILYWRNKLGAHLAASDPRKEDNLGTLEFSLMSPVVWKNGHYYFGSFSWTSNGETSTMPEWSLVEMFEKFIPRFWPTIKIEQNLPI